MYRMRRCSFVCLDQITRSCPACVMAQLDIVSIDVGRICIGIRIVCCFCTTDSSCASSMASSAIVIIIVISAHTVTHCTCRALICHRFVSMDFSRWFRVHRWSQRYLGRCMCLSCCRFGSQKCADYNGVECAFQFVGSRVRERPHHFV